VSFHAAFYNNDCCLSLYVDFPPQRYHQKSSQKVFLIYIVIGCLPATILKYEDGRVKKAPQNDSQKIAEKERKEEKEKLYILLLF